MNEAERMERVNRLRAMGFTDEQLLYLMALENRVVDAEWAILRGRAIAASTFLDEIKAVSQRHGFQIASEHEVWIEPLKGEAYHFATIDPKKLMERD